MRQLPPYRLATERLVIRCWEPRDAAGLKAAVDGSLEHLRRWMPWAWDDPQPLADKVERLRTFRGNFDLGTDFVYSVWDLAEREVLGGAGLHPRSGPDSLEIGYWVTAARAGQGIASEVAGVLTRVALEICGVDRVEIGVEPGNGASEAIPRKLGYEHEGVLRRRLPWRDEAPRDRICYALFAEGSASALAAMPRFDAWDAAGLPIEVVGP